MSVKFQMVLPDDLAEDLKRKAAAMEIPAAEFVRQSVRERLKQMNKGKGKHPFGDLIGLADMDETDLSTRVDELVYDEELR